MSNVVISRSEMTGVARTYAMLAEPTRLQILLLLGVTEQHVGALCQATGKTQQAVSHHLTILKLRELVAPKRRGKNNFYALTDAGRALLAQSGFVL